MRQLAPAEPQFEALLQFLHEARGFDFTGYKRPSLMRRVQRRLQTLGLATYDEYRDHLEVHQDEFALLFNAILINVTSFFRDPAAWDVLAQRVIPAILERKPAPEGIRAWSAGCASGEEAYTLAMLLAETMGEAEFRERAKVYATDVDQDALNHARLAAYRVRDMEPVAPALREKYFQGTSGGFQFRSDLRRSVIFGRHDLVQDAPISRLDLLVCRNTLMYFNTETQARVLRKFHYALTSEGVQGYLFLGRAEMLLTHGALFTPLDLKCRIFMSVPPPKSRPRAAPVETPVNPDGGADMRNEKLRELALEDSAVARIVVDAGGLMAVANQRARAMFSINPKDLGRPLSELEVSYRPLELRSLMEQAYAERRAIARSAVERRFPDGERHYLDVMVSPLFDEAGAPLGVAVSFLDVTRYQRLQEELRVSREELQTTNEELQSSNEELETTNEELQSSNEELETTNEELQSTNEELETMNEELQSTNEELNTANSELRQRTDDLHHSNAFLQSVLGSMPGAAVVVNRDLNVLVWSARAEDMWGLRADEVQGKSLLNLDIGLPVAELRGPIRACLQNPGGPQSVTLEAVNRRGKTITCRLRCTPLVGAGGAPEGVILLIEETE